MLIKWHCLKKKKKKRQLSHRKSGQSHSSGCRVTYQSAPSACIVRHSWLAQALSNKLLFFSDRFHLKNLTWNDKCLVLYITGVTWTTTSLLTDFWRLSQLVTIEKPEAIQILSTSMNNWHNFFSSWIQTSLYSQMNKVVFTLLILAS